MKFYDREKEIALLEDIERKSRSAAQMTFVVGRRRIGKTALLTKVHTSKDTLYFFVTRKNEALLCEEYTETIQHNLEVKIYGELKNFKDVFGYLLELSHSRHFTLIIDEFQEFTSINPSIYGDMQHIWDMRKEKSKMNLILCGSVYSLMKQIFEHSKEPLFGRATGRMRIKPLGIPTLKQILSEHYPGYSAEDLLAFYMVTGGVAKYVELLCASNAFTLEAILDEVFSSNSLFLDEGRNMLIDEFGKDYGNYFSILSLIASSKTSRTEIESVLSMQVGGFLDRLESDFGIIERIRPILSKPAARNVKYKITDNFLNFWFRFIYKYRGAVEMGNFEYVKDLIKRDYAMYSGKILERYFTEKISTSENLSAIGSYWESGNQNEIDIVAINDYEQRAIIVEVKRQSGNINMELLQKKTAGSLVRKLAGYKVEFRGLSMKDM